MNKAKVRQIEKRLNPPYSCGNIWAWVRADGTIDDYRNFEGGKENPGTAAELREVLAELKPHNVMLFRDREDDSADFFIGGWNRWQKKFVARENSWDADLDELLR